jgi:hypothetical protein
MTVQLSKREMKLILDSLVRSNFGQEDQKEAFELYNKLVAIHNASK